MRHTFAVLLLFWSASCLQAKPSSGDALVMQSWHLDPATGTGIARFAERVGQGHHRVFA
jgi:hypothetical protein